MSGMQYLYIQLRVPEVITIRYRDSEVLTCRHMHTADAGEKTALNNRT